MSQTDAPLRDMVPGRLGLQAEPIQPDSISTKVQPAAASFYGRAVIQGAGGDDHVAHPSATLDKVIGVVAASHTVVSQDDGLDPNYPAQAPVVVLSKGKIWVAIDQDVAVGDDVYFRHTGGGEGKFRADADTANADQLLNARWAKGGLAADGLALLELAPL